MARKYFAGAKYYSRVLFSLPYIEVIMQKHSVEDMSKICAICKHRMGQHRFSDNNCPSVEEGKGSIFGGNYELTKFKEMEPKKDVRQT